MTNFRRILRYQIEDGVRDILGKEITERVSKSSLDSDIDDTILGGHRRHTLCAATCPARSCTGSTCSPTRAATPWWWPTCPRRRTCPRPR